MPEFFFEGADWVTSDATIKVLGVGGAGCNAVDYMYQQKIEGCSFLVCNTDSMHLRRCQVPLKIQLGAGGLGAGTNPIEGRKAALESQDELKRQILDGKTQMLFVTAGMGGGTGTGATPVIAKMAKDEGILTVGVVTIPFINEGRQALTRAIEGVHELEKNVDSLIIINNEKLYEYYGNLLIHEAFPKADEVLATAVRGIVEIIKCPGHINVDFKDVKTMMKDSGMALMGCGEGTGKNRIEEAVKGAFESPLLNDFDLKSAKNVMVNVTYGKNEQGLMMEQMKELNDLIDTYTGGANNFKRGLVWDENPDVGDKVRITSIVTGLRFTDVLGESARDVDSYITIDRDFTYDKESLAHGEGISLPDDGGTHIGYSNKANERLFRFEEGYRPVLLVDQGMSRSELEETPAIRRNPKKSTEQ